MRFTPVFKTLALVLAVCFPSFGTANIFTMSRIIPSGKVKVYQEGKLVQVLKEETLLPAGRTLMPEGDCGLRLNNNFFMVCKDGSIFSVKSDNAAGLKLEKGLFYFALNRRTGPVVIETPSGVVSTEQIITLSSSTATMLKGYLDVSGSETTMGVLEGGSLVVSTPEGMQTIDTGRQITIAQAAVIAPEPAAPEAAAGKTEKPVANSEAAARAETAVKPDFAAALEGTPQKPRHQALVDLEPSAKPKTPAGIETADAQPSANQKPPKEEEEKEKRRIPAAYYIGGGALAGAAVLGALLGGGGGGGGDSPPPASPSKP